MKVLFLCRYPVSHIGGVERHVSSLSKVLVSRGYKIRIINRDDIKYPEIKIVGLLYIWFWLFKNLKIIQKSDIIHCHDVFVWYLPFRFLFPKKKVFITFHGYESYPVKFRSKVIRKISEKLSNGNICIGEFIKKWYGTNPTYVSYGAVDLNKFKGSRRIKYNACFSGRFDNQTGIKIYAKAVEEIRKKRRFKFIALGNGVYMYQVKNVAITPGWVKNPSPYLNSSKFAFTEGYLSILEAFAAKKLVFAVYNSPLKKDYLKMTPYKDWIVISGSPEDLARKIRYYSKYRRGANEKIKKAYGWVKSQTWKHMADIYEQLWFN